MYTPNSTHAEGPARQRVGTDGGAKNEEEYVGKTNELNVASEVAGGDKTAETSEGDVGFLLCVITTGAREGEDRSESIQRFNGEGDDGVDWDRRLPRVKRGIQQSECFKARWANNEPKDSHSKDMELNSLVIGYLKGHMQPNKQLDFIWKFALR